MVSHLKTNKLLKIVITLLFLVCTYIYVNFFMTKGFDIPCPIKSLTNLECPGCGITRMFISIFKFDFYQAFRYNPLLFILFILYMIKLIIDLFTDKLDKIVNTKFYIGLIIVLVIYGILRNIEMFSFLKPTVL